MQNDDRISRRQHNGFHIRKGGRLNFASFIGNTFQGSGRDLLADNSALVGYAEKNKTAQTVKHGADRLCGLGPLTGGTFEFKSIRFTVCDEIFKFAQVQSIVLKQRIL